MQKFLAVLSLIAILTSCAGREGRPINVTRDHDSERSCESIKTEVQTIRTQMLALESEKSKTVRNVVCVVTGIFLIVPFFFMDLKNGEGAEYDALAHRLNHLQGILTNKKC